MTIINSSNVPYACFKWTYFIFCFQDKPEVGVIGRRCGSGRDGPRPVVGQARMPRLCQSGDSQARRHLLGPGGGHVGPGGHAIHHARWKVNSFSSCNFCPFGWKRWQITIWCRCSIKLILLAGTHSTVKSTLGCLPRFGGGRLTSLTRYLPGLNAWSDACFARSPRTACLPRTCWPTPGSTSTLLPTPHPSWPPARRLPDPWPPWEPRGSPCRPRPLHRGHRPGEVTAAAPTTPLRWAWRPPVWLLLLAVHRGNSLTWPQQCTLP